LRIALELFSPEGVEEGGELRTGTGCGEGGSGETGGDGGGEELAASGHG
jgi:hypothetical protein